ncbi:MAG: AMP-binding protein [Ktedonobacteraceae bacterium]
MSNHYLEVPFEASTLVELLCRRALQQPESRTYTFLIDGEVEGAHLTYADLNGRARAIGAVLQQRVERGSRAMLIYPADLEFTAAFFGCLYAGVIAVPTYPPQTRTKRSLAKLRSIMNDVQPSVVLTISSLSSMVESLFAQAQELQGIPLITTDDITNDLAEAWHDPAVDSNTLAFLQYTSGSTGMPKGVMLTHGNLLHNLTLIHRYFEVTPEDQGVTWLPPYHDMGLIGMILGTVYAGVQSTIMSPVAFLQRPIRWLQAISNTRATVSGGPNFAYDLCVRKITPEQKATLDLSSWSIAVNGAEPIRPETLDRFVEAFAPCGFRREAFYPCYGLAEASLIVAGGQKAAIPVVKTFQAAGLAQNRVVMADAEAWHENENLRMLVGSGQVAASQKIVIVDPESLTQCLPGQVGEIWVSGPSVAQGYWQKPEETECTFRAYLAGTGEGPFLRTGDLGFLQDGELFVTGRLKDLIIIRGRNHYPQDIELTVEQCHPALRAGCGVAFSVDASGEERLVIVYEVERQYRSLNVDEVVESIRQAVAEHHELQVYAVVLIKMSSIPKTSSGKLQRRASREAFLAGNLEVVGEWILEDSKLQAPPEESSRVYEPGSSQKSQPAQAGAIQAWLVSHIAEHLKVETSKIDVREPLARYGMDSVQAVNLAESLASWLGRELSPTLAYEYPTIEALAQHLAGTSSALPGTATMDSVDTTTAPKSNGRSIREELLAHPVERQHLLEDYIREKVASVLKLSSSKLDTEQSLSSLGLDSLLAMELKNWIEEELGVQVPITIFLQEPSIAQFSAQLLDQLVITASTPSIPLIPSETQVDGHVNISDGDGLNRQAAEQLLADLDQLSDEEVDALLSQISQEDGWTDATNGDDISQRTAEQLLADLDQLSDEEVDSLLSQMSQKEPD